VGFRYRKSFKVAPGIRMTVSKSGIGYSAGGKGYRVTKRADGRIQQTLSAPGTGFSYTTTSGRTRQRTSRSSSVSASPSALVEARRRARAAVPKPRHMKIERRLLVIGFALTVVGVVVLPLLLLAVPCMLVALVMMLVNLKKDLAWAHEYKSARADALAQLTMFPPSQRGVGG
jgi:Protein of unknown function (DUF4236)